MGKSVVVAGSEPGTATQPLQTDVGSLGLPAEGSRGGLPVRFAVGASSDVNSLRSAWPHGVWFAMGLTSPPRGWISSPF